MNVLDLFSGAGGFSEGFKKAGFNIFAGVDIWDVAIKTYCKNGKNGICEDLTKITPDDFQKKYNPENKKINILIGAFPCQSFSMAGRRLVEDARNDLFEEYVKYLDFYSPNVFVIENVIGLLSKKNKDGNKVIDIIISRLETNYTVSIFKLYADDFEVPQRRRRVIIIGFKKSMGLNPVEPLKVFPKIPIKAILLKREDIPERYFLSEKAIQGIKRRKENNIKNKKGFGAQFADLEKPSYTISSRYWKDGSDCLIKYSDTCIRRLTEFELQKIQSFPDDYIFEGSKKDVSIQIGNAVPCKLAYHIAQSISLVLKI